MIQDLHAGANPAIEIDGIVMTMYSGRTKLGQQVVQEVVRHFPDKVYESMIPRTVRLGEAPSFGKPVIVYDRTGIGATAYRLLAREFIRRHEPSVPVEPVAAVAAAPESAPPPAAPDAVPSIVPAAVPEAAGGAGDDLPVV
jgi:chromosome partitioning protein